MSTNTRTTISIVLCLIIVISYMIFKNNTYPQAKDIYSYEQRQSMSNTIQSYLHNLGWDVKVYVLEISDNLNLTVHLNGYSGYSFAAVATDSINIVKQLLNDYNIGKYELNIRTNTDYPEFYTWSTTDLESGTLGDTSKKIIKYATIQDIQLLYGYETISGEVASTALTNSNSFNVDFET